MKPSKASPNRLSKTLKYCSSQTKEIFPSSETKVCIVRAEVLSALLTMTFIARQLGLKVSLKVSGKEW